MKMTFSASHLQPRKGKRFLWYGGGKSGYNLDREVIEFACVLILLRYATEREWQSLNVAVSEM